MESRTNFRLAIFVLCAAYIGARFWQLTDSCLWFDELFSLHAAEYSWGGMFAFLVQDLIHPPLFYALLKLWISIGGDGLFWLRSLPVLFSVLALVPFFYLCKELKLSRWAIIIAIGLFAVNGALIKLGQTVRMYSLLMFLALTSIWLFARYFNRGKSWAWLVVVNILLVYTHYYGWLVIGSEFLAILVFQRMKLLRAAAMVTMSLVALVPWLVAVLNRERLAPDLDQNISWQPRPDVREMFSFLLSLVEPFYAPANTADVGSIRFIALPMLLITAAAIGIYVAKKRSVDERRTVWLLLIFTGFPVVVAIVMSWLLPNSIWGSRHLIVAAPIFLILTGAAIASLDDKRQLLGAVGLLGVLTLAAFVLEMRRPNREQVWCGWERVSAGIRSADVDGGQLPRVYAFENLAAYHLWFAGRKAEGSQVALVKGVKVRTNDQTYFLPRGFTEVPSVSVDDVREPRFWLAFRVFSLNEEFPLVEEFTRRAYRVCQLQQKAYGRNRIVYIEFVKEGDKCGRTLPGFDGS